MTRSSSKLVSSTLPGASSRPRRRGKAPATKRATIIRLLQRRQGASLVDLTAATGWQEHSVRAALTGLRRQQVTIERIADRRGNSVYRIVSGRSS